ncbi:hypothetical protein HF521_017852, partial [Silurus meridionalis]
VKWLLNENAEDGAARKEDKRKTKEVYVCGEVMASGNRERHRILSLKEESPGERTPGDTLPWNLSKYQKVRRSKSASAEVLDPAERAVIRIAERFRVLQVVRQ